MKLKDLNNKLLSDEDINIINTKNDILNIVEKQLEDKIKNIKYDLIKQECKNRNVNWEDINFKDSYSLEWLYKNKQASYILDFLFGVMCLSFVIISSYKHVDIYNCIALIISILLIYKGIKNLIICKKIYNNLIKIKDINIERVLE